MKCPECGEQKNRVLDNWKTLKGTKRVRKCQACNYSWTTTETIDDREKINNNRT